MNNPLHHIETLRDNLIRTIAYLETMFREPILVIDQSKIPDMDIEAFIEEWKKHQSKILPLPVGSYEITYTIDEKYQKMIDMYKEHLKTVNSEINKYKQPSATEEFSIPIHYNNPKVSSLDTSSRDDLFSCTLFKHREDGIHVVGSYGSVDEMLKDPKAVNHCKFIFDKDFFEKYTTKYK